MSFFGGRRGSSERGFSIIEVLVAMAIMSVVFTAVSRVLVRTQSSFEHVTATTSLRQYARTAFNRMTFEIRSAGYNLKTAPETFTEASATNLSFAADLDRGDPDGACTAEGGNDGVERVNYRISDGRLGRSVDCWVAGSWTRGSPFRSLADDIDPAASGFAYFDVNGGQIGGTGVLGAAQRALISRVRITLTLTGTRPAAPGMPPARYRAVTDVLVRNAGGAY